MHGSGTRAVLLALALAVVSACGRTEADVSGEWVAENTSLLRLYLYRDGRAVVSGVGALDLEWRLVEDDLVRIDALDRTVTLNFILSSDDRGLVGRLNLIGYDAARFRMVN